MDILRIYYITDLQLQLTHQMQILYCIFMSFFWGHFTVCLKQSGTLKPNTAARHKSERNERDKSFAIMTLLKLKI